MPQKPPSQLYTDDAFTAAVHILASKIAESLPANLAEQIRMYLAGGVALHLYTGSRVTNDVDSIFSHRILVPQDIIVRYTNEQGEEQLLEFDYNYNPALGLLHPDYEVRATPIAELEFRSLKLFALAPVDLAISKLSRFSEIDREDIRVLIRTGFLDEAEDFQRLAEEALSYYVGNDFFVRQAIADVRCWIDEFKSQ